MSRLIALWKSELGRTALVYAAATLALLLTTRVAEGTGAGGLALLGLAALLGAAFTWFANARWPALRAAIQNRKSWWLSPPAWARDLLLIVLICAVCVQLFAPVWDSSMWRVYDWGPHHANLKHLVDALREGGVPHWVHGVSTGDSPYELYPLLPYYLAARAAIWTDATDLTLVMLRGAILVHSLSAVSAALLARRLLSTPWALLVGVAVLYDSSSVWAGGVDGILQMGVTHAALANALWPLALAAIVDALKQPRWSATVRIWFFVWLCLACHPLALVSSLAAAGALLVVALLAVDVRSHRALTALLHVAIGVSLATLIWLPLTQRLTTYGVHFSLAGAPAWQIIDDLMRGKLDGSIVPLLLMGYVGVVAAIVSRRAGVLFVAVFTGVLLVGLSDQLYVLLDLAPSPETARFQTTRLLSSAKPGLLVCAAFLLRGAFRAARSHAATSRLGDPARLAMGALLGVLVLGALRGAVPFHDSLRHQLHELARNEVRDPDGLRAVSDWIREQHESIPPQHYARLLHEDSRRYFSVYHVTATSGVPGVWVGSVSCLFLRERIEDESAQSLRRFNVRWVMRLDGPPTMGDPTTERRFGRYFVHELPSWDGQFARVEKGGGRAVVTQLEDERVEVDLQDTNEPSLVALGTGYYPRWRAHHESRGALPVYALPSIDGGKLSVVSAWLPPGRTVFTATGALPSDHSGWWLSLLGGVLLVGCVVVDRRAEWRRRTHRWIAWTKRRAIASARRVRFMSLGLASLSALAIGALSFGVLLWGLATRTRPDPALQLGSALFGRAQVEVQGPDASWTPCPYSVLRGGYRCAGPILVQDGMVDLLNDAPPSPPFSVPAVRITSWSKYPRAVRVRVDARLSGRYWAATNAGPAELSPEGAAPLLLSPTQTTHDFDGKLRTFTLSAQVSSRRPLHVAIVRQDTIDVPRDYPLAPPQNPLD